jgi:hypothetical protein
MRADGLQGAYRRHRRGCTSAIRARREGVRNRTTQHQTTAQPVSACPNAPHTLNHRVSPTDLVLRARARVQVWVSQRSVNP